MKEKFDFNNRVVMTLKEFNRKVTEDAEFRETCKKALANAGDKAIKDQIAILQYKTTINLNEDDKGTLLQEVNALQRDFEILSEMIENPTIACGVAIVTSLDEEGGYGLEKIDEWDFFKSDEDAFYWAIKNNLFPI